MKVSGKAFENKRIVKDLCKMLLGTLEYKLRLFGFMSQFAFVLSLGSH